jgi:hypothetical protein
LAALITDSGEGMAWLCRHGKSVQVRVARFEIGLRHLARRRQSGQHPPPEAGS